MYAVAWATVLQSSYLILILISFIGGKGAWHLVFGVLIMAFCFRGFFSLLSYLILWEDRWHGKKKERDTLIWNLVEGRCIVQYQNPSTSPFGVQGGKFCRKVGNLGGDIIL